jgi:hypothetical protein
LGSSLIDRVIGWCLANWLLLDNRFIECVFDLLLLSSGFFISNGRCFFFLLLLLQVFHVATETF